MQRQEVGTRIKIDPVSGCWLYQGAITKRGYGNCWIDGKNMYAHIVMYELAYGPVPRTEDGAPFFVDHVAARGCISRACCNPAHLEAVTPKVNVRRGRSSKLNADLVAIVKQRLVAGDKQVEIARDFGVGSTTIGNIAHGRTWTDVTPYALN